MRFSFASPIGRRFTLSIALIVSLIFTKYSGVFENDHDRSLFLSITLFFGSLPLIWNILSSLARRKFGIDIIAITAVAGSAFLSEYTVGIIILIMLSTGEILETYAFQRAKKEISHLLSQAPTKARKKIGDSFIDVPVNDIFPKDIVIVRSGESVPVDGMVIEGEASLDESMLTGESVPVSKKMGSRVMSGSINQEGLILIQATEKSADSQYEKIIRLVREAQKNEAPFVRIADRYSTRFTFITILFCLLAWFLSHDPKRVLSVLVVATPCPLILAVPIAFSSGMSRAAKRGVIIKNGGALEHLDQAKSFVFDKTGTVTFGSLTVRKVDLNDNKSASQSNLLHIAASIEQYSDHVVAHSISLYAKNKNIILTPPKGFQEIPGKGASGIIDNTRYFIGSLSYIEENNIPVDRSVRVKHEAFKDIGIMIVYIASLKGILGDIHLSDSIRPETQTMFRQLLSSGINRIVMLTGDKENVAKDIAQKIGIQEYRPECLPEDKLQEIKRLKKTDGPVIMVGDGVNDAPSLVEADTGIAIGARGSGAAVEAGDIVIIVDAIDRVAEAFGIGKITLSIAKQSIAIGIGLSIFFMALAASGAIPPTFGAIVQEVIDVIAIGDALRVHSEKISFFSES